LLDASKRPAIVLGFKIPPGIVGTDRRNTDFDLDGFIRVGQVELQGGRTIFDRRRALQWFVECGMEIDRLIPCSATEAPG
ncbi:hypothetical protein NZA98_39640, partial [Escherichia coli]|nr:hypothetical protein [Escherichia coli]